MSDLLKHVIVADAIGLKLGASEDRWLGTVFTAFGLGVISHAIMDISEPDYTVNWFSPADLRTATPFLTMQVSGMGFVLSRLIRDAGIDARSFHIRIAAIIGAVIPDIIDGIYAIINPAAWYSGHLLLPWHVRRWQVNLMSMWSTMFLTALLFALRFVPGPLKGLHRRAPL